ncbi:hypothetical protein [Uliginosibacterium sediminicola]|uniref:OmpL-like beta-barrel porin-2 n=1 Tax=Uliginosibacterium sediminicola TaxID=2024550 RepID=A0ABU9YXZ4_9RHOO
MQPSRLPAALVVSAIAPLAALAGNSAQAAALDFKNVATNIQYAYALDSSEDKALGYGAASSKLRTFRFHHEDSWRFGNNSFLYDYLKSDKALGGEVFGPNKPANFAYGDGSGTYFWVAESELLGSKVFGLEEGKGLLKDIGLSARVERGGYYKFHAFEYGPRVHLNVPGLDVFKLALWRREKSDISGSAGKGGFDVGTRRDYRDSWLVGADLKTSWQMFGYKWTSQTFIRYQIGRGGKAAATGDENINGIPSRVWIEPDVFMELNPHLAIGLRDYYLRQSDAIDNGYSTAGTKAHHVPQIVLKASF